MKIDLLRESGLRSHFRNRGYLSTTKWYYFYPLGGSTNHNASHLRLFAYNTTSNKGSNKLKHVIQIIYFTSLSVLKQLRCIIVMDELVRCEGKDKTGNWFTQEIYTITQLCADCLESVEEATSMEKKTRKAQICKALDKFECDAITCHALWYSVSPIPTFTTWKTACSSLVRGLVHR